MVVLLVLIYVAFVSLGLPDSMLGAAWPALYPALGVPVSWAGVVSLITAGSTIFSSLVSERLIRRCGTGPVVVVSVALTAVSMLAISFVNSFWVLCLLGVPLGLGGGSVDCALNNYVALHYKARHMSWLHCFWGVGATLGPNIMGICLGMGLTWASGYRTVGLLQTALVACLLFSLPLWKRKDAEKRAEERADAPARAGMLGALRLPGVKGAMLAFFFYCSAETCTGLWAGSYMVLCRGISKETAASLSSLFFFGIMAGRLASGFVSMRFSDKLLVRAGEALAIAGALLILIPGSNAAMVVGLVLMGVGCAPIFPSMLHETPANFGAVNSPTVIGMQMASAYTGSTFMPLLIGAAMGGGLAAMLPWFILAFLIVMTLLTERVIIACGAGAPDHVGAKDA